MIVSPKGWAANVTVLRFMALGSKTPKPLNRQFKTASGFITNHGFRQILGESNVAVTPSQDRQIRQKQ